MELNIHYVHTIEITNSRIVTTSDGQSISVPVRRIILKSDKETLSINIFGHSEIKHLEYPC